MLEVSVESLVTQPLPYTPDPLSRADLVERVHGRTQNVMAEGLVAHVADGRSELEQQLSTQQRVLGHGTERKCMTQRALSRVEPSSEPLVGPSQLERGRPSRRVAAFFG